MILIVPGSQARLTGRWCSPGKRCRYAHNEVTVRCGLSMDSAEQEHPPCSPTCPWMKWNATTHLDGSSPTEPQPPPRQSPTGRANHRLGFWSRRSSVSAGLTPPPLFLSCHASGFAPACFRFSPHPARPLSSNIASKPLVVLPNPLPVPQGKRRKERLPEPLFFCGVFTGGSPIGRRHSRFFGFSQRSAKRSSEAASDCRWARKSNAPCGVDVSFWPFGACLGIGTA